MDLSAMMPLLCLRGLLLLLLSFSTLYSTRALKVYLLDTLNATSELNWRTYSNQDEKDGWLEETMYSRFENKNHQVYSTCNYESSSHNAENWLLIPSIENYEAQRFYLNFNFTIVRCAAVEALRTSGGCKETLKLYATQFDNLEEIEFVKKKNWHNETTWDYVDTLASHSTTDNLNNNNNEINIEENNLLQKQQDQQQQNNNINNQQQTYTQTSSYDVKKRFVHFALRNTGACSSILSVKIYYNVCPKRFSSLLHLPRTVSSRDPHGVVTIQGTCAENASPVATILEHPKRHSSSNNDNFDKIVRRQFPAISAPTAICKSDGTWQLVGSTECVCDQGFSISMITGFCTGLRKFF